MKPHELSRLCAAALIAFCVCGCVSSTPAKVAPANTVPPVLLPLPAEYPEETSGWDTGAPVMILSLASVPHTAEFTAVLKPALEKRGYTVIDLPFFENDWMSVAARGKSKFIVPNTYIQNGSPVYQGKQVADRCYQVLVADAGEGATSGNPRIRAFHVWARHEFPAQKVDGAALAATLVDNLMRMPAFRAALEP